MTSILWLFRVLAWGAFVIGVVWPIAFVYELVHGRIHLLASVREGWQLIGDELQVRRARRLWVKRRRRSED